MDRYIEYVHSLIPELSQTKRNRYELGLGLSKYDSQVLTSSKNISEYFEEVIK
jgi:aspartyl-tRNA(Asn)/glutamyl-tRNA(Gln) amidotransferase subunit B